MSDSGTPLPELYDRIFPKATAADYASAQALMETSFGAITEQNGKPVWSEQQKWQVFRVLAEESGWSGRRLEAQIKHFLRSHVYPTWKPADIFAVNSTKVYRYPWYVEQCREGNAKFVEAYRVQGVSGLVYRMADGRVMPPEFERVHLGEKRND